MKRLIYINACMRSGSRTLRIADKIVSDLKEKYIVETIDLRNNLFTAVDRYILEDRDNGIVPQEHVETARKIASADRIIIAAPFWDMSFPIHQGNLASMGSWRTPCCICTEYGL